MKSDNTVREIFLHLIKNHPELVQEIPIPQPPLSEQTSIIFDGDFLGSHLSLALLEAFKKTMALSNKLPEWIVKMQGMSGKKYRYLINNLIQNVNNATYLEIGSWAGSTACSAIWENKLDITCIDNWSEFGGPREIFFQNIENAKNSKCKFEFIEKDFRKVDYTTLTKANIYMFDGPHALADQYDGIIFPLPALQNQFVLIVDDYNVEEVKSGTKMAIAEIRLNVQCSIEIITDQNAKKASPIMTWQNSDWHNGYFIAVVNKQN